jgi:hypothetical protein
MLQATPPFQQADTVDLRIFLMGFDAGEQWGTCPVYNEAEKPSASWLNLAEYEVPSANVVTSKRNESLDAFSSAFQRLCRAIQCPEPLNAFLESLPSLEKIALALLGNETGCSKRPEVLAPNSMEVYVDPRAEWKHMYYQVWRDERDFFYDPGLHGLNLEAARTKYEPYLESIASRDDLNYLFAEMLGNITSGHMYLGGGDTPEPKRVKTGLLGADYSIDHGRYRFARIYNGEN